MKSHTHCEQTTVQQLHDTRQWYNDMIYNVNLASKHLYRAGHDKAPVAMKEVTQFLRSVKKQSMDHLRAQYLNATNSSAAQKPKAAIKLKVQDHQPFKQISKQSKPVIGTIRRPEKIKINISRKKKRVIAAEEIMTGPRLFDDTPEQRSDDLQRHQLQMFLKQVKMTKQRPAKLINNHKGYPSAYYSQPHESTNN